jgi:hypothetical protein
MQRFPSSEVSDLGRLYAETAYLVTPQVRECLEKLARGRFRFSALPGSFTVQWRQVMPESHANQPVLPHRNFLMLSKPHSLTAIVQSDHLLLPASSEVRSDIQHDRRCDASISRLYQ